MGWSEPVANLIRAAEWMEDFIQAVNEDRVTENQSAQYEAMMAFIRKSIVAARDYIAPTEATAS